MEKTYLFAGASSAIAEALLTKMPGDYVIGLSTKSNLPPQFAQRFQVEAYASNSLPDIEDGLDGLVYFPGSINLKPFQRLSEADFMQDYQRNALGAVAVLQKYLPNLKKTTSASVVLISSVAATQGMTFHSSISMAKAAIEGLTRALSAELAPAIRVNAVAPSLTQTPLAERLLNAPEKKQVSDNRHPLKRVGQPDDIANAIQFLLSDQSAWMTGQILHVDGGMSSVKNL